MTLGDLIETFGEGADVLKLFVGWDEVIEAKVRTDRVYPYIELVLEDVEKDHPKDEELGENHGD